MEIRQATIDDALFVAKGVIMALHRDPDEENIELIANICRREDVLYSYRHTLIAFVDDIPVGLCLCYDGKGYHETRIRTFKLFEQDPDIDKSDEMDFEHFEDETHEGEYYIDSLAVLPEYRNRGIAKELMLAQMKKGSEMGLPVATLLVDPENPDAQSLYSKLGFEYQEDIYAFGQIFWKLSKKL